MKLTKTLLIVLFIFSPSIAEAQKRKPPKSSKIQKKQSANRSFPSVCDGGVANKMATVLPKPVYSDKAKSSGAKGVANVQVKIDEEGNVIEARACSGDLLLREAAVEAAKKAKFKPTMLSGNPVKISGIIVYNFTP